MKPKAIRFSENEQKLIDEFLRKNPFFDFSSLGRTAILSFIKNPTVTIQAVRETLEPKKIRESESPRGHA